jgi:hypothetical protein
MKEIVDYITLKDLSVEKLDIQVLEYIGKGWQPYFGMSTGSGTEIQGRVFLQTMVKYKI